MQSERREWTGDPDETADLDSVRVQIIECLMAARGGSAGAQSEYFDEVLRRAGAAESVTWGDLYRTLNILQEDALADGADPLVVRTHAVQLQRILEQVDD